MTILLNNNGYSNTEWHEQFIQQLPEIPTLIYPDVSEPDNVHYAVVWEHPQGDLKNYKNLKAIFLLGAGMEHLLLDKTLPDIPLVPLLDPIVAEDMANYALYWVMNAHRGYDAYRQQQANKIWQPLNKKPSSECIVTVLGLGRIGQKIVDTIDAAGYDVSAWDFKDKILEPHLSTVKTHAGISELYASIKNADVVINCLASTDKTQGLINADFLSQMSSDSTLINVSRGAVVNEPDLLDALNHEGIKAAVLDVFCKEPLTPENALWNHPKVTITPHISGSTYASSAAKIIINNIKRMEKGEMPVGVYDRNR